MAAYEIRVSSWGRPFNYIFQAKETLKKHGKAEFHAVGSSIVAALRAADRLNELGYTEVESICTESFEDNRSGTSKHVAKLRLTLTKSADFERLYEEFEKQRQSKQ